MRLSDKERAIIKKSIDTVIGDATVYLFGSRVDDTKKGGDIDLYIIPKIQHDLFRKKLKLKTFLEDKLYKPVDIVISKNRQRPIEQEALKKGIKIQGST